MPQACIHLLGSTDSTAQALAQALQAQLVPPYRAQALPSPAPVDGTPPPALVLLLGLDGPADAAARAWDVQCRTALAQQQCAFQVLYGSAAQRLQAALRAVHTALPGALGKALPPHPGERAARLRNASCEKCSDPECEQRLFTVLKGLER